MKRTKGFAPIESGVAYPLPEFHRRTGLGEAAMATCRKAGLVVRRCGGRSFVLGADFVEFLATCPTTAPSAARPEGGAGQ